MKYIRLTFLLILSAIGTQGQTIILDEPLLSDASYASFTAYSVTGAQGWNHNTLYGAVCSGYTGQSFENEDWLVSPSMDLTEAGNATVSFSHARGNAAVANVGVSEGWYKVFATAGFTGDPSTTQWIEVQGFNALVPVAWQYVSSGELVIPEAAKSSGSRIAFRYISSNTQSATWEIKNVRVVDNSQVNPGTGVFRITNWNIEWLGCTANGPSDETLQINNAAAAMLAIDSDIYCIQEISNTDPSPTIATLVSLMGSAQWDGAIVPSITGDCDQRQAIIYKRAKVQLVNAFQLSTGNAAEGNTYYYNWSSGRYPAVYDVNLLSGSTSVPVTLINIHAKAEDGEAMSYTRRLGASESLKDILDGPAYNAKNLIVVGDFNDYLSGTTSTACACTDSPYANFIADTAYSGLTQNLFDTYWGRPLIEHFVISNELAGNYMPGSAAQETAAAQAIDNYHYTTSDHLPVTAAFEFPELSVSGHASAHLAGLRMYPNPVGNELHFENPAHAGAATEIYDLTGRIMGCEMRNANTIDVSALPEGVYILKVGDLRGRFVKG